MTAAKVHIESGGGDIVADGDLAADNIAGTFKRDDGTGTFSMHRTQSLVRPYHKEDVTFNNGSVKLAGTLLVPNIRGTHPAVIFVHGSGPEVRWGTMYYLADRMARHGIAALVFDKRGSGESTGDWKTAKFDDLADDVIAGERKLQGRKDIAAQAIGIYGHSQGASIAPLILSRAKDLAFVIGADMIGGPLYEQELYRVRNSLEDSQFSEAEISAAMGFYATWLNVLRTGKGWELVDNLSERFKNARWFSLVAPPPRDSWIARWYPFVGDFNDVPYWEQVKVPTLLVYGEKDRTSNPKVGFQRIEEALRKAGNVDFTEVLLPRAAHTLKVDLETGQSGWTHIAPGYPDLYAAWILLRFPAR